jgi:hypothetical protein
MIVLSVKRGDIERYKLDEKKFGALGAAALIESIEKHFPAIATATSVVLVTNLTEQDTWRVETLKGCATPFMEYLDKCFLGWKFKIKKYKVVS